MKQEDITRLNTDNSRLVTELKNSQKENYRINDDLTKTDKSLKLTQNDVTSLNNQNSSLNEEITSFKTQVDSMSDQIQSKDSLLIQLKEGFEVQRYDYAEHRIIVPLVLMPPLIADSLFYSNGIMAFAHLLYSPFKFYQGNYNFLNGNSSMTNDRITRFYKSIITTGNKRKITRR